MADTKTCQGDEYGFSPIECDNPATEKVKVGYEDYAELCAECYDTADIMRTAAWESAYRRR